MNVVRFLVNLCSNLFPKHPQITYRSIDKDPLPLLHYISPLEIENTLKTLTPHDPRLGPYCLAEFEYDLLIHELSQLRDFLSLFGHKIPVISSLDFISVYIQFCIFHSRDINIVFCLSLFQIDRLDKIRAKQIFNHFRLYDIQNFKWREIRISNSMPSVVNFNFLQKYPDLVIKKCILSQYSENDMRSFTHKTSERFIKRKMHFALVNWSMGNDECFEDRIKSTLAVNELIKFYICPRFHSVREMTDFFNDPMSYWQSDFFISFGLTGKSNESITNFLEKFTNSSGDRSTWRYKDIIEHLFGQNQDHKYFIFEETSKIDKRESIYNCRCVKIVPTDQYHKLPFRLKWKLKKLLNQRLSENKLIALPIWDLAEDLDSDDVESLFTSFDRNFGNDIWIEIDGFDILLHFGILDSFYDTEKGLRCAVSDMKSCLKSIKKDISDVKLICREIAFKLDLMRVDYSEYLDFYFVNLHNYHLVKHLNI